MDYLRRESMRRRQQACQARRRGDGPVGLRAGVGSVGFSGLQTCGSITCPHCGPKIAAERRAEIREAVAAADTRGLSIYFGTLTVRHHAGQSADAVMDAVSKGWAGVTSGRRWRQERDEFGILGFIRVWETKYGRNGWHTHAHFLLFVDPLKLRRTDTLVDEVIDAPALFAGIFERWSVAVQRAGFAAPLPVAQDFHLVENVDSTALGRYMSKAADPTAPKPADRMAWEMSSHGTKGRRYVESGVETRWLLEWAADGDEPAGLLWGEYELAMKGRRTIAWSRGLRVAFGLKRERTDEEIAAEDLGDVDEVRIAGEDFSWAVKHVRGFRGDLLHAFAAGGAPAALEYLAALEIAAWVPDPPSQHSR